MEYTNQYLSHHYTVFLVVHPSVHLSVHVSVGDFLFYIMADEVQISAND